jgi:hypothetical protein
VDEAVQVPGFGQDRRRANSRQARDRADQFGQAVTGLEYRGELGTDGWALGA